MPRGPCRQWGLALLCLLVTETAPPSVLAQPVDTLASPPARTPTPAPLWESPAGRRGRERRQREQTLADSITWLPGVEAARVHLGYAQHDLVRAVVVARTSTTNTEAIRKLVSGALPALEGSQVEVLEVPGQASPPPTPPLLTSVGPFSVAAHDAQRLRGALATLLALNGLLAGLLIWMRVRRLRR